MLTRFLSCLAVLLLAACAGPIVQPGGTMPPRDAVGAFRLEARFSVSHGAERHAGRLSWRHEAAQDELQLSSPFGQTVAELHIDRHLARLVTSDQRVFEADDVRQLTQDVLGYPLPVGELAAWVLGRASNGGRVDRDPLGRPAALSEAGWRVIYDYAQDDPAALPSQVTATRAGGPELRLRIDAWQQPDEGEGAGIRGGGARND